MSGPITTQLAPEAALESTTVEVSGPAVSRSSLYLEASDISSTRKSSSALYAGLNPMMSKANREHAVSVIASVKDFINIEGQKNLEVALNRASFTNLSAADQLEFLDKLDALVKEDLHQKLRGRNAELVQDILTTLVMPADNHQGLTSNCTVASCLMDSAKSNSLEYTRYIADLALYGVTYLNSGQKIKLFSGHFATDKSLDPEHRRSLDARIGQDSAIEFCHNQGVVGNWRYNFEKRRGEMIKTDSQGQPVLNENGELIVLKVQAGLWPPQFQAFYHAYTGHVTKRVDCENMVAGVKLSGAELLRGVIKDAEETQRWIKIEVDLAGYHAALFDKLYRAEDGTLRVRIRHSWPDDVEEVDIPTRTKGSDQYGRYEDYDLKVFEEQVLLSACLTDKTPRDSIFNPDGSIIVTEMGLRGQAVPAMTQVVDGVEHVVIHVAPKPKKVQASVQVQDVKVAAVQVENAAPVDEKQSAIDLDVSTTMAALTDTNSNGPEWYTESHLRSLQNLGRKDDEELF